MRLVIVLSLFVLVACAELVRPTPSHLDSTLTPHPSNHVPLKRG